MKIDFAKRSISGRRDYNQDYLLAEKLGEDSWLFVVADGMGGTKGGEIASEIASETLLLELKKLGSFKSKTIKDDLMGIFLKIQTNIRNEIKIQNELAGMGTTLVCLLLFNHNYIWASVGDSRIYKVNGDKISQLTEDHTYVQDYINKNGAALPSELTAQYDHFLTRSLDGNQDTPDIYPKDAACAELKEDDFFLLNSDGLILDKVNTNVQLFKNYILGSSTLQIATDNLVAYAYTEGSRDNISAILIKVGDKMHPILTLKNYELPETNKTIEIKKSFVERILTKNK